ncbi:G-protein coupled receptor GRL101-like [Pomacea canaliculata]|uniref:G-protein coupled receptor GRL101-like n=1 Tax=Pomacea canaliculata TaxID=400727 RepID=UPI000D731A8E|nr:G-protein coupled receptor GRL101-like [Pomacea canaliculata]
MALKRSPRPLDNGLWDCSVPYYNTFKLHLECNQESECDGGQDEGLHCPYSSLACNGSPDFVNLSNVEVLNMSFSQVQRITDNGFTYLVQLKQLDVRNNPLDIFPRKVLKAANYLQTVYCDNYKLCCPQNLPDAFETGSCFAPVDEISSCDDLLRSDIYRVFLWLFCVLSITGNIGGFLFRQRFQKSLSLSGFNVFVTNLSVSDFLMGVYLAILGVADETYRSIYLWHDLQWRDSTTCKVAGFLSFMSSEVSTLIICLITIDRFIVLRFPFSKFRFERWSASWACGLAWAVGFTLAAVPLLPSFFYWEFYGQNAICIPLPITRKSFRGRNYSFGIMIVFNMFLFILIALGRSAYTGQCE